VGVRESGGRKGERDGMGERRGGREREQVVVVVVEMTFVRGYLVGGWRRRRKVARGLERTGERVR